MPAPQSTRWCGTCNNPTLSISDIEEWFKDNVGDDLPLRYVCAQEEIAPTTRTRHVQFYFELHKKKALRGALAAIKDVLPGAHLEIAKGSAEDNLNYCSDSTKEGANGAFEIGVPASKTQGKSVKLTETAKAIASGGVKRKRDIDPELFVRHDRGLAQLLLLHQKPRNLDEMPRVVWRYGPTGTGKSMKVNEDMKDKDHYKYSPGQDGWFDGYDGQECLWIEELRADEFKIKNLLALLDKYEYRTKVKGGFVQVLADEIHICCPVHPRELYPNAFKADQGKADQLARRISVIFQHRRHEEPREVDWDFVDWDVADVA